MKRATLHGFDPARFLHEHWQKSPCLIRNPWRAWANPLAPDELAGLACEPEVESRLVRRTGPAGWQLVHGPLSAADFAQQGDVPWTLLVQAVDHHVPDVAALLQSFRFLPNWRIDDVMVSYASDGGGVGPHYDQYDVFLVQGLGRRRWRVGSRCDDTTALLPHDSLRLLADFEPLEDWVLDPGDILYLPPGIAHDGVAVGDDCMTYSVGFRAPSRGELVSGWAEHVLDHLGDDDRYADADLRPPDNPGEIAPEALDRMRQMVTEALGDAAGFARWAGGLLTEPKSDRIDWTPDQTASLEDLRGDLLAGSGLERNPASRFAFARSRPGGVVLFVNGAAFDCHGQAARFAERICAHPACAIEPLWAASDDVVSLIRELVNSGSLAVTEAG